MSDNKEYPKLANPIVDEVRAIREAIDEEVGHDIAKLAERAKRIGDEYRRRHGMIPALRGANARGNKT